MKSDGKVIWFVGRGIEVSPFIAKTKQTIKRDYKFLEQKNVCVFFLNT